MFTKHVSPTYRRCSCGELILVQRFADHYLRCVLLSGIGAVSISSVLDRK